MGFPCELTDEVMALLDKNIASNSFLLFGEYRGDDLAAIGALSIFFVFPCPDSPCGLIGHIDRVLQRDAPYREGLEFCISCFYSTLVLLVQLAQTHSHLSTARPGSSHYHQRLAGLDIFVLSKSLSRTNQFHIGGVSLYAVVEIDIYSQPLQSLTERQSTGLPVILRYHHRVHH